MKFYIIGGGDSKVGIPATDEIVEFTGNIPMDKDNIILIKSILREFDDNGAEVLTEDEYNAKLYAEEKYLSEVNKNGHKRNR